MATPALESLVVPISVGVLVALFAIQRKGTASVGVLFGPVMLVWFITLAGLVITSYSIHYTKLYDGREAILVRAADRAGPVGRNVFPGGAGSHVVVGVAHCGVVNIATNITDVFSYNFV